jgi:hypothetical protein
MSFHKILNSKMLQVFALTAALGMVGATVAPRKAEAIVGLATWNVPAIVVGGVLAGIGTSLIVASNVADCPSGNVGCGLFFGLYIGLPGWAAGIIGLIILDAEDPSSMRFQALNAQNRSTLGVSDSDYRVYISELEEVNAAWDEGAKQALRAEVSTAEQAQAYFEREFAHLAPETRKVMSQVLQQAISRN